MSKHWVFKSSPIPDDMPKTLADVPEGVICVVSAETGGWVCRKRSGHFGRDQDGHVLLEASKYRFISYIDGHRPPEQPKQWTFADVPVGRCFKYLGTPNGVTKWRCNHPAGKACVMTKYTDGRVDSDFDIDNHILNQTILLPLIAELVDDPTGGAE